MKKSFSSVAEQVAHVLRDGLREGRWKKTVPGRIRLAEKWLFFCHRAGGTSIEGRLAGGALAARAGGEDSGGLR